MPGRGCVAVLMVVTHYGRVEANMKMPFRGAKGDNRR